MSMAACLLTYSMVVAVLGPLLLCRVTHAGTVPRLGIAVWVTAMASVIGAWVAVAVLLAADLVRSSGDLSRLLAGCFATLTALIGGGYGTALQAGLSVLAALALLTLVTLAGRVVRALHGTRIHTRRHADAAHLAARGAPRGPGGALIVDAEHRSVYCVAGPRRTIVITRPALRALDDAQLAAVLAHEHAHLNGRHHHLLALTAAMASILPGMALFTDGAAEVARLVEMCADDVAARGHTGDTVVGALLALTLGPPAPTPAPALGAAAIGVADRVERLLFPPAAAPARLAQILALGALLFGPLVAAALIVTQSPLCITALG
jgi:hypothetical protein